MRCEEYILMDIADEKEYLIGKISAFRRFCGEEELDYYSLSLDELYELSEGNLWA